MSPRISEVVINVPDVSAECIGSPLQRPGEQGQLAPKAALLEGQDGCHPKGGSPQSLRAAGTQQPHVVKQGTQRVVSMTQEDVSERRVRR